MKKGRKPLAVPRIRMSVFLRMDLAAEVELLLMDPMRERAKYGAKVGYFEELVRADLDKRRVEAGKPKFESELDLFEKQLAAVFKDDPYWTVLKSHFERFRNNESLGDGGVSGEGDQPEGSTPSST